MTYPGEYRVLEEIRAWGKTVEMPVEIVSDNRFICEPSMFNQWAKDRKHLRMECFYRELRKKIMC